MTGEKMPTPDRIDLWVVPFAGYSYKLLNEEWRRSVFFKASAHDNPRFLNLISCLDETWVRVPVVYLMYTAQDFAVFYMRKAEGENHG